MSLLDGELDIFIPAQSASRTVVEFTKNTEITGSCPCNTNNNCTYGFCGTFTCSGVPIGCTGGRPL